MAQLNPLAQPKGKKLLCEICAKVGTVACLSCGVTYYCSKEHQTSDWLGIHQHICPLVKTLRTLPPAFGADEELKRKATVRKNQQAIVKISMNEATRHLSSKQYELSIPGGLQVLRYSIELHGSGKPDILPAYLLLAEANLGLRREKPAEEYLIQAHWILLHQPSCTPAIRSRVHRNFGKLFAMQQRYQEALTHLATDVFFSAQCFGPNHINTAGGYALMAEVFNQTKDRASAVAFFDKVVEIWFSYLANIREADKVGAAEVYANGSEQLRAALELRCAVLGSATLAAAQAMHVLGLLHQLFGNAQMAIEARKLYVETLQVYIPQLGDQHESTVNVRRALDLLDNQYPNNGLGLPANE